MRQRVAALYVQDRGGSYSGLLAELLNVDPWPESRDARRYDGPYPVVAHPPCQRWGLFAKFVAQRFAHKQVGADDGCFEAALAAVRKWGGVLEHPRSTLAWSTFGLQSPAGIGWQRVNDREWVCEVWQSAYGHRCQKATWLLYVGDNPPAELLWDRKAGSHRVSHDKRRTPNTKGNVGKHEASATPVRFRDALLDLARGCR